MADKPISISDFDFDLPKHLIAQNPIEKRSASRLLVSNSNGSIAHEAFSAIGKYLKPHDTLVINDTKVFPGRVHCKKESGGKVELLFIRALTDSPFFWECMSKSSKPIKTDTYLYTESGDKIFVQEKKGQHLHVKLPYDAQTFFNANGTIPLPPYIRREANQEDTNRYQTVYAEHVGAIAAPTAGLHFTHQLITQLTQQGITIAPITLHVGPGTFLPIREDAYDDISKHRMHTEQFHITPQSAAIINNTRKKGGRICCVGTTAVRTLESSWQDGLGLRAGTNTTDIFIYPGYIFKAVDMLITNFHLPKSTLLLLVSAFAGDTIVTNAYAEAIANQYRFFSYGDACLFYNNAETGVTE